MMSEDEPPEPRVDRTELRFVPLSESEKEEKRYWQSRTPAERLRHAELLRRINYGAAATARMERVLEVVPAPWITPSTTDPRE